MEDGTPFWYHKDRPAEAVFERPRAPRADGQPRLDRPSSTTHAAIGPRAAGGAADNDDDDEHAAGVGPLVEHAAVGDTKIERAQAEARELRRRAHAGRQPAKAVGRLGRGEAAASDMRICGVVDVQ